MTVESKAAVYIQQVNKAEREQIHIYKFILSHNNRSLCNITHSNERYLPNMQVYFW